MWPVSGRTMIWTQATWHQGLHSNLTALLTPGSLCSDSHLHLSWAWIMKPPCSFLPRPVLSPPPMESGDERWRSAARVKCGIVGELWQQIKPSSLTQPNSRPLVKQSTSTGWLAFTKITKSPWINLKLGKQHKLQLATKKSHNGVDLLGCFAWWHLFSPVFPLKSGVTGLMILACLYHIRHTHKNTSAAFTSALQLKRNLRATAPTPEAQSHGMTCLDRRESPAGPPLKSSCLRFTGSRPSKRADASFPQPGRQASRAAGQI